MIQSRLWFKATLLILVIILISSMSIALYTIPLTREITYKMAENHATALLDHVYNLVEIKHKEIKSYKNFALTARKRQMKDITSAAGYIIKNQYSAAKAGEISEPEAKQRAIKQMKSIRYGNKDYMWISDFNSVLISHPDPKLHNADFSKITDVYGHLIVPPMVDIARKNGEGFTSYWWNRLEKNSPSEKLTYSTLFPPWNWVYGTGVYMDDILQEIDRQKKKLVNDLREVMQEVTIGKSGYMYIFDSDMHLIIHPNEKLTTAKLNELCNPRTGRPILKELMEKADIEGVYLEYPWDHPEDPGNYAYEKISWVRYNSYFKWYIASSVYTDELYSQSRFLTSRIVFITIIILLFSLFIGSYCLKKFINPIEKLSKTVLKIQGGDLKIRSGIVSNDEIGILAREFDAMVEKLDNHVEVLDQKVKEKTRELAENYKELEYANSQVMESIRYARTIQKAILPQPDSKPKEISDIFILWRPKDIIGGDIFWLKRNRNGFVFAIIDCTGHGVPGAIMTMIASMAIHHVVQELGPASPGAILKELNRIIQFSLGQHSKDAKSDDGLDIALCYVDTATDILTFAGANISLFVQEETGIQQIKGDKQSIGYKSSNIKFDFKEHKIKLNRGKQLYMTTDGLIGQAGGTHGLPFGRRRFLKFISEHHQSGFSDQKKALEKILTQYQGNEEQRDDITVIGLTYK
ncbi:cache domain-containing protein [Desulfobacula phenolica]|uniref:Serine phosphatase RsbU, regulator of sigma subunit n=1 Tax=Desulfobacula phenolica TaxID=90732 RepID=A0A1H2GSL1_9BACT|nr:cache domain-containing protein [Desulfobacula phenolica]SDU22505.1 Serine phosphatase RsbU, regulator of sigma subunit [Desulfobacula phenolica]